MLSSNVTPRNVTPRNVTIRAPRKCGFCKEPGHNILTCDSVYRYSELLFQTAFVKIQTDVLEKKNCQKITRFN